MFYQVLALIIWGSSFIAAKYSYEMLDAALMVEARLLIAALMVLPSCYRHFGKIPRRPAPSSRYRQTPPHRKSSGKFSLCR